MKLLCKILSVCLWVAPLVAQTSMTMPDGTVMTGAAVGAQYTSTDSYTLVDNQSNCVTYNCLILTNKSAAGTTVSFSQVSSGFDGYTLALDGSGNIWNIPSSHTTTAAVWSKVASMGTGLKGIAVRAADEVYVLYPSTSCTAGYAIKRWDGTAYHSLIGCAYYISVSVDDTLAVVGSTWGLGYATNPTSPTPNWIGLPGTFTSVAAASSQLIFGVKGNVLWQWVPGSFNGAVSGAPAISSAPSSLAATSDGYLFVRSNVAGTRGNLYVYTFGDAAATAWTNLKGTVAFLGGSNRFALFAQDGAANLYHYLAVALSHTSNVVGR